MRKATQVQLNNGERFDVTPDRFPRGCGDAGVEFDGGTIPWSEVAGFWTWCPMVRRMLFVPVDQQR